MDDREYTQLWNDVSERVGAQTSIDIQMLMEEAAKRAEVRKLEWAADWIDAGADARDQIMGKKLESSAQDRIVAHHLRGMAEEIIFEEIG